MFAVVDSTVAVSASSWLGVMRAEMAKRTYVREPREIERAATRVAARARGIFAPRLVVVSSVSTVWRDVVVRLAAVSDIILIDVSVPSANLLWEVSTLATEHGHRRVLIVENDSVAGLTGGSSASGDASGRLTDLLDGEEVLAYGTGSRSALRQFARALRSRCETTVHAG
jgi:CBS domain-containing protein